MSDREAADAPAEEAGADEELDGLEREVRERRRGALAQVRKFGDPVLKSAASPVDEIDSSVTTEAERMIAIMRDSLGIGLAATQLGLMRRVLVFQAGPDSEPRALVNPRVEWLSDELVTAEEGCLSLPGVVVDVERPLHARVSALDTTGSDVVLEASGLEARVLQHEIDHLDGVLILDRTEREQRRGALRALRSGESFSPEMLEGGEPGGESGETGAGEDGEPGAGSLRLAGTEPQRR